VASHSLSHAQAPKRSRDHAPGIANLAQQPADLFIVHSKTRTRRGAYGVEAGEAENPALRYLDEQPRCGRPVTERADGRARG
jgi:hypothetical protein